MRTASFPSPARPAAVRSQLRGPGAGELGRDDATGRAPGRPGQGRGREQPRRAWRRGTGRAARPPGRVTAGGSSGRASGWASPGEVAARRLGEGGPRARVAVLAFLAGVPACDHLGWPRAGTASGLPGSEGLGSVDHLLGLALFQTGRSSEPRSDSVSEPLGMLYSGHPGEEVQGGGDPSSRVSLG